MRIYLRLDFYVPQYWTSLNLQEFMFQCVSSLKLVQCLGTLNSVQIGCAQAKLRVDMLNFMIF